jgi:hypothetical protein
LGALFKRIRRTKDAPVVLDPDPEPEAEKVGAAT